MKSVLFSLIFLFIPKLCISQLSANDKMIYLDSLGKETTNRNHKYYRIIIEYNLDKTHYKFFDYYNSGVLYMQGKSESKDELLKDGEFIFYYENGNKKTLSHYNKAKANGKHIEWYENGNKKLEGVDINTKEHPDWGFKLEQFWDTENVHKVIDGTGDFEVADKNSSMKGKVKNGVQIGTWTGTNNVPHFTFIEEYANGELISGISKEFNNVEHKYKIAELKPIPKKGYNDFYKYVGKKFNIPKEAYNISGKIILEFVVEKDGSIVEIKVKKGMGYGLDEEAIRVLSNYNNWAPGKLRGIDVRCSFSLPISIQSVR
jgi:hypothetical protein